MKKTKTLLAFLILFGCDQNETEPYGADFQKISGHFNTMLVQTLNHVKSEPVLAVVSSSNEHITVKIDSERIEESTHNYLSTHFFEGAQFDYAVVELDQIFNLVGSDPNARPSEIVSSILHITNAFSENQKQLLAPFMEKFSELNDLQVGEKLVSDLNEDIIS